ncbi:MAG: ribonuclease III [Desulfobulbaceae bacterium]|nr:ribonuclease III [Desulfobulbaceae bacterium]
MTIHSLVDKNRDVLLQLEKKLDYHFKDLSFLQKALIHSSFAFEQGELLNDDNETMEFLGDAVLDLAVGHGLYQYYPAMKEGDLTRLRAALVNERHLATMAKELGLGDYLLLGKGEEASNGRGKPSILSCAFEAVMGAIFLDGGYAPAAACAQQQFTPWFKKRQKTILQADAKSSLQELLQERFNEAPRYVLEHSEGPDHAKTFFVTVRFRGEILGDGNAPSKKEAEQRAAAMALLKVDTFDFSN